jgi:hypothetical protein
MKDNNLSEPMKRLQGVAIIKQPKKIKGIGRRIVGTLIEWKSGRKTWEIKRVLAVQSDPRRFRKHRTINKNIVVKGAVKPAVAKRRQESQG